LEALKQKWISGSASDLFGAPAAEPVPDPFAGLDQLHVSAIWREPDRQFAVINRRIVRVGESILGFRLDHCDRNAVWLGVPTVSRRLSVSRRHAVPGTGAPPRSPMAASPRLHSR
jgi:hypothetical protein